MKTFKLLFVLSILSLGFISCTSDDDPVSRAPIIGTWQINSFTIGNVDLEIMQGSYFTHMQMIIENDSMSFITYESDGNDFQINGYSEKSAYSFDGTHIKMLIELEEEDHNDQVSILILDHLSCVYENNTIHFMVRGLDHDATIAMIKEDENWEGMEDLLIGFSNFDADMIFLKQE